MTAGTTPPTAAAAPEAKCACGHGETGHLDHERGRGPCQATIGGARCPCPKFTPGGTALDTPPPKEPLYKVVLCGRCHRPIIWTTTTNARRMAVDSEPALQGGNVKLEWRGPDVDPLSTVLSTARCFGRRNLRKPHQATCPAGAGRR